MTNSKMMFSWVSALLFTAALATDGVAGVGQVCPPGNPDHPKCKKPPPPPPSSAAFVPVFFSMISAPGTCQHGTDSPKSHPSFLGDDGFAISRFPFYRSASGIRDFITPKVMRNTDGKDSGDPLLVADSENDFIFDDGWWGLVSHPRDRFPVVLWGYDITLQSPEYHRVPVESGGGHGTYFMGDVDADGCEDQMFWSGDHRDSSKFHGIHNPLDDFPYHFGYFGSCFLNGGTGVFTQMKGEITVFVQVSDPDGPTGAFQPAFPNTPGDGSYVDSIQRGLILVDNLFKQPACQVPVERGEAPKEPCNTRFAPVNAYFGGTDISGGFNDCGRASSPQDAGFRPGCPDVCDDGAVTGDRDECVAENGACSSSNDCCGGHLGNAMCVEGVCTNVCVPSGGGCFADSDCCAAPCSGGACS